MSTVTEDELAARRAAAEADPPPADPPAEPPAAETEPDPGPKIMQEALPGDWDEISGEFGGAAPESSEIRLLGGKMAIEGSFAKGTELDLFAGDGLPELPPEDTDCGWLVRFLLDGSERSLNEILAASFRERGHGLTVHSRASDLRDKGFDVAWRHEPGATRGAASRYRLVR